MCTWWGRLALKLQPRQYTYKFAGKIVTMVPQLREEKLSLPDEVLQLYHEHGTFPLFVVMLPSIAHVMVNQMIFKICIVYDIVELELRRYRIRKPIYFDSIYFSCHTPDPHPFARRPMCRCFLGICHLFSPACRGTMSQWHGVKRRTWGMHCGMSVEVSFLRFRWNGGWCCPPTTSRSKCPAKSKFGMWADNCFPLPTS